MTIEDKLLLLRAGYTKAEIEAQATEQAAEPEQKPVEQAAEPEQKATEQAAEPEQSAPDWAAALQVSIEKLTKAVQHSNVLTDDMGEAVDTVTRAEKALAQYITGK